MSEPNQTILVVDDESSVTQVIALMLESAPFDVLTVNNGEHALGLLKKHAVDAVLTDLRMDGMDGFELMTRIRQLDAACPVIAMTACDSYDMVLEALKSGAYDYLEKPLQNVDDVLATLQRAVDAGRLMRQNAELLTRVTTSNERLQEANDRLLTLNRKLHTLANTDSLTGLQSRRFIEETMEYEVGRRIRNGHPLSLVLIEIDRNEAFAGEYGNADDDLAITHVAGILKQSNCLSDLNARVADSTFAVVLPEVNANPALECAAAFCQSLADTPMRLADGGECHLSVSAGVASLQSSWPVIEYSDLVSMARQALTHLRLDGRQGQAALFDPLMRAA